MGFWLREVVLCCQFFWMWLLVYNSATLADVKTCSSTGQVCHQEATCMKSNSSSVCVCRTGFTGNGTFCADVDECAFGAHSCHGNAACVNRIGYYACLCNVGYTGDGVNCTIISVNRTFANTTTFPPSKGINSTGNYSTDGNVTSGKHPDVAKCSGSDSCHANASCRNMSGFIECVCHAGFNGNGVNCTDIDECRANVFNCGVNTHCVNTIGSYLCECDPGYFSNGQDCLEVDHCGTQNEICDPNARCVQEDNFSKCACDEGYFGDGMTCEDVDECVVVGTDACDRNSTCKNIAGSYLCCTDLESCQEQELNFPPHDNALGGGISEIHQSSEYTESNTAPNNQARLWGSTIGVVLIVVFIVLLGVMGYRYRRRVLSERLSRHPSTIIAQIEIMMMEEQRMRDNSGDNWSLKSGIFGIPSASPSLLTLNEGDSHTNMLRKSDFRI